MRKNDVRKWIHATLDLLPLLVIPIFALAVRSDNNFDPISVEVLENKEVGFNQLIAPDLSTYKTDYYVELKKNNATGSTQWWSLNNPITFNLNHQYYVRIRQLENVVNGDYIQLGGTWQNVVQLGSYAEGSILNISTVNDGSIGIIFGADTPQNNVIKFYFNLIDLTQMYGVGNEPTKSEFDQLFTDNFYEQTDYKKVLIPNVTNTYNDTDVGSQLVYTLYRTVDNYFNFNNVFSFNQIYDWLTVNIFGGNPPLSVFIVWNIFLYEFLMDLIFLLYALFMFFIDMCTNLIDRFTCSASGRSLK